jgi:glycosyltransferase involved in cell wall biosynthesis
VHRFTVQEENKGYYLVVSRLVQYKRIDIAIEACERLGRPLKIVGSGPEEEILKSLAQGHTEFLGFVPDEQLPELYAGAKALLFPQEEDFGITPVEAAAAGKPTIAYRAGGALETIQERRTGLFFNEQTPQSLMSAIEQFETGDWDTATIRRHAEKFNETLFKQRLQKIVDREWQRFTITI